jgi:hypothetical protein
MLPITKPYSSFFNLEFQFDSSCLIKHAFYTTSKAEVN